MKHTYLKNVATLSLRPYACIGCGMCAIVCPHRVFTINERQAVITAKNSCMECGACALNCPANAISVNASVGCATAIINGWLRGGEVSCDCSGNDCC